LAEDLLNQLDKEEEQDEKAKAQRKLKKYRNKINKLAKQLNISPEEVEDRLKKEE
jgi:transcriptional regulator with PAS, ATPase and Fis domain